ncbi:MAG: hypothetical protein JWO89_3553 [Verrucomicrobiaceae bacterium]|nr:hypothetical protein [Verrucomicrobiaceae bacterium]
MKLLPCLALLAIAAAPSFAADFTVEKSPAGAVVKIDGQLFTEYVTLSENKPILWPIIGPTGEKMTRDFPMLNTEGERQDHPHHRSLWFAHINVNGSNFWAEKASFEKSKKKDEEIAKLGLQKHREFTKLEGGKDKGAITSITDWMGFDGKKLLEDERRISFSTTADARVIDFDIDLKATEGPVTFFDNKDGVFGLRLPTNLDVEQKGTGHEPGHIVNSNGITDVEAWGKPANWVDYYGKVKDEPLGVAILNHPSSFRAPTLWHVRTYGLFAANCFALHDFDKNAKPGDHTIAKGDTLKFRYRVIFHKGDVKAAKLDDAFAAYAKEVK